MSPASLRRARRLAAVALIATASGSAVAGVGGLDAPDSGAVQPRADEAAPGEGCQRQKESVAVRISRARWPHIAAHLEAVRRQGEHPQPWHLDRAGANQNREESLRGIPTRPGHDREEAPPAVAREGGAGASVRYVRSSENRSAGAYMGNKLSAWCDGQAFRLIVAP